MKMVLKFLTKMPRQFYKERTVLSTNSNGIYANTHKHTHTLQSLLHTIYKCCQSSSKYMLKMSELYYV